MAERAFLEALEQLLREARGWTWKMVEPIPQEWIYRRVEWTDNTIGWHMGHLSWELDVMTDVCFGVGRELDAEWDRLFAAGCEAHDPAGYPPVERLTAVFQRSMRRFLEQLGQVEEDEALGHRLRPHEALHHPRWTLLNAIVNLMFHEGEHSAGIGTLVAFFEGTGSRE